MNYGIFDDFIIPTRSFSYYYFQCHTFNGSQIDAA